MWVHISEFIIKKFANMTCVMSGIQQSDIFNNENVL